MIPFQSISLIFLVTLSVTQCKEFNNDQVQDDGLQIRILDHNALVCGGSCPISSVCFRSIIKLDSFPKSLKDKMPSTGGSRLVIDEAGDYIVQCLVVEITQSGSKTNSIVRGFRAIDSPRKNSKNVEVQPLADLKATALSNLNPKMRNSIIHYKDFSGKSSYKFRYNCTVRFAANESQELQMMKFDVANGYQNLIDHMGSYRAFFDDDSNMINLEFVRDYDSAKELDSSLIVCIAHDWRIGVQKMSHAPVIEKYHIPILGVFAWEAQGNELYHIRSCQHYEALFSKSKNGHYTIYPHGEKSISAIPVYCDMRSNPDKQWIVIQRRENGQVSFAHSWVHYKRGFGDFREGDFWLGNENIHQLTTAGNMTIKFEFWDYQGQYAYDQYTSFSLADENNQYQLSISGHQGNAGNMMSSMNGVRFSTYDSQHMKDNSKRCSNFRTDHGGWWFSGCNLFSPNGKYENYEKDVLKSHCNGLVWYSWKGCRTLKKSVIKIAYN